MTTTAQSMTHKEWLAAGNPQRPSHPVDGPPRRAFIEKMCPAELAIRAAILAVEDMGANPELTLTVIGLNSALMQVGDVVDNIKNRNMTFAAAMRRIHSGKRTARTGWNGKGMFIFLVHGSKFRVNREPLLSILGEGTEVNYAPHIDIKCADGSIAVWTPTQADMMAGDWVVVE